MCNNTLAIATRKEVGVGSLVCSGIVWEPNVETSSHATRQWTLLHSRLGSLSHCGLILAQRVKLVRASRAPLKTNRQQQQQKRRLGMIRRTFPPKKFSHAREKLSPPQQIKCAASLSSKLIDYQEDTCYAPATVPPLRGRKSRGGELPPFVHAMSTCNF